TRNVEFVTVLGSIGSLVRSAITAVVGTLTRPLTGFSATTTGGVRSGPAPTANCVALAADELPATSVTPATVTVITWPSGSRPYGVRKTSRLPLPKVIE